MKVLQDSMVFGGVIASYVAFGGGERAHEVGLVRRADQVSEIAEGGALPLRRVS